MMLQAVVRNGRLELSEPTDLPEGEVVDLVPADEAWPDDRPRVPRDEEEERARVLAAYEQSRADSAAGRGIDAFEMIAQLRAKAAARAR